MDRHTVIGISGKMGSGKTTLANALVKKYSGNHFKFATPLYEMHDAIKEILIAKYGYEMKKKDGKLLQLLGTEWGRNTLGQNFWVDLTKTKIEDTVVALERWKDKIFIVVDDARFDNELDLFLKFKTDYPEWRILTVRLEADEDTRKLRCEDWRVDTNHLSEIGLDHRIRDFDMVLSTRIFDANEIFRAACSELEKEKKQS